MNNISQIAGGFCHAYYMALVNNKYDMLAGYYGECLISRGDATRSFTNFSKDIVGELKEFHTQYSSFLTQIYSIDAQPMHNGILIIVTGAFEKSGEKKIFVQTFVLKTVEDQDSEWTAYVIVNDILRILKDPYSNPSLDPVTEPSVDSTSKSDLVDPFVSSESKNLLNADSEPQMPVTDAGSSSDSEEPDNISTEPKEPKKVSNTLPASSSPVCTWAQHLAKANFASKNTSSSNKESPVMVTANVSSPATRIAEKGRTGSANKWTKQ